MGIRTHTLEGETQARMPVSTVRICSVE
jgi:hypothetical protein